MAYYYVIDSYEIPFLEFEENVDELHVIKHGANVNYSGLSTDIVKCTVWKWTITFYRHLSGLGKTTGKLPFSVTKRFVLFL